MSKDNQHIDLDGKIAIIGLGYVGLPLAVAFGRLRPVVGFDHNPQRMNDLLGGIDVTNEVPSEVLADAHHLSFSSEPKDLTDASIYIVCVPSPIDSENRPNLDHLLEASRLVGRVLAPGDIVIYESTVYPGCTEEDCIPEVERVSGLKLNLDFFAGYSPERVNPGDSCRSLKDVVKVVSGSTPAATDAVNALYSAIIDAGTYRAPSIRIAEAAKVIENTQRDLNIALMNELAIIFDRLGLDTAEVLAAAETKWNFMPFRPGLVGGHCIGVDPYYLTHKAQMAGYNPEVILAGRRINNEMASYVADKLLRQMAKSNIDIKATKILIMGVTFKENCPDTRNTRVVELAKILAENCLEVDIYDPVAILDPSINVEPAKVIVSPADACYDAIIIAVAHDVFRDMGAPRIRAFGNKRSIIFDVKNILPTNESELRL